MIPSSLVTPTHEQ